MLYSWRTKIRKEKRQIRKENGHEYAGSAKKKEIGFGCDVVAGGAFFICRGG